MTDRFVETWVMRGVLKVIADISLLPGDKFRIEERGGKYRISMLEGNALWNTAVDLEKKNKGATPEQDRFIDRTRIRPRNSLEFSQIPGESQYVTGLQPVLDELIEVHDYTYLTGAVPGIKAIVSLYLAHASNMEDVIIVKVDHGPNQNGTAHGDRPQ